MVRNFLIAALVFVGFPESSYGYIDPGLMVSLYQVLYVVVMGALGFLVFKPWIYLKNLFAKIQGKKRISGSQDNHSPHE